MNLKTENRMPTHRTNNRIFWSSPNHFISSCDHNNIETVLLSQYHDIDNIVTSLEVIKAYIKSQINKSIIYINFFYKEPQTKHLQYNETFVIILCANQTRLNPWSRVPSLRLKNRKFHTPQTSCAVLLPPQHKNADVAGAKRALPVVFTPNFNLQQYSFSQTIKLLFLFSQRFN